ncbi:AMP-binding protein [Streptomyces sp. CRN 30]|uniref:AMP-binding protein n=1 Tax=Streptomyces sp. CRN 30 TaxID=3075613 RepID=UPI002A825F97|nr:AMP-binding protein [Streptomyces sp. CRN 30]
MGERVDELVGRVCARWPDRPALSGPDGGLDFAELDRRATALAARLRPYAAGGHRVAVRMPRSVEQVVTVLACWKAGGVAVPVDPSLPRLRADSVIGTSGCRAVADPGGRIEELDGGPAEGLPGLAYVFFTSGSSGEPKAVGMPHSGIVNEARWTAGAFRLTGRDRGSWLTSPGFALSRWELWSTLAAGASVRVAPEGTEWSAGSVRDWLLDQRVDWSIVVTSLGERLFGLRWPATGALRLLVTGGEQLRTWPRDLPFDVVNSYGVTETTGVRSVAWLPRTPPPSGLPSFGTPIARTRLHVLDDGLSPVEPGTPGELYVAGFGLAHGYLGRAALTAERFVPDPFDGSGGRMYRTGDLVRLGPDGHLQWLARRDAEMKIDGARVDASEVEAAVLGHPAVAATAASMWRDDSGRARLVCHVVVREGAEVFPHELRSRLAERLPRAMVPTVYLRAERLPLLPSGKLDRARLPAPGPGNRLAEGSPRALDATERAVVRAFTEVLDGDTAVAGHDDFLALGGDSQALTRVRAILLRGFGVALPMRVLFERRTPVAIAAAITEERVGSEAAGGGRRPDGPGEHAHRSASRGAAAPALPHPRLGASGGTPVAPGGTAARSGALTGTQERMWFLEQLSPGSTRYLEVVTVRLGGAVVDVERLRAAAGLLVRRSEGLRTAFLTGESGPVRVVSPDAEAVFQEAGVSVGSDDEVVADLASHGLLDPFDLERAPLARWRFYPGRGPDVPAVLALVVHHIVWDGRSAEVCLRDLVRLYDTPDASPAAPVPPPEALPRRDGGVAGRDPATRDWLGRLAGARPHIWADPVLAPGGADRLGVVERRLDGPLVAGMRGLAGALGVTPFVIGTACLTAALRPFHSGDELTLAAPVSVRTERDTDEIGFFVNLLPLRVPLHAATTGRALLSSVRDTALETWRHRSVPFQDIVGRTAHGARRSPQPPYSQAMFLHNRLPGEVSSADGVRWRIGHLPSRAPKCDTLVYWIEDAGGWTQRVEYDTARLDPASAARLSDRVLGTLRAVAEDPDAPLVTLPDRVMSPAPVTSPAPTAPLAPAATPGPPPAPDTGPDTALDTSPDTALERRTADAWAAVLGVDTVAADDNFFERGGSSVAAARLVVLLRSRLGVRVPVRLVFDTDTFAAFVSRLRRDHTGVTSPRE